MYQRLFALCFLLLLFGASCYVQPVTLLLYFPCSLMQRFINAKGGFAFVIGVVLTYLYISLFHDAIFSGGWWMSSLTLLLLLGQIWSSVFVILSCILISQHTSSRVWKVFFLILIAILITMMLLDALALSLFGMKFSPLRFSEFFSLETLESSSHTTTNNHIVSIILILLIIAYVLFWGAIDFAYKKPRTILIALVTAAILAFASGQTLYNLSGSRVGQLFLNPLVVTLNDIRGYATSQQQHNALRSAGSGTDLQGYQTTVLGQDTKPNIILLFAESFSPEYSKRNGGLSDSMPHFDRIEQDGMTFTQYMAPGCVSEHAHTSLLQGVFPLRYGDLFTSDGYEAFYAEHDTLGTFFRQQGYETAFVSTAPLSFLRQDDFIKKIGYQTIIDETAFSGSESYIFDAAPDEKLYSKTIETVSDYQKTGQPFFLTLQTISSHIGWNSPYGTTEKDAVRYADDTIGSFYDQLRQSKFFDNGILIIISDHRIPGTPDQTVIEKLGPTRPARVMATMIGTGIKANSFNDNLYQAIDFHFGIKQLISDKEVDSFSFINNPFDTTVRRTRGLHYCKYKDNTIWTIQNNMFFPLEDAEPSIQDFVATYQEYQFRHNIVTKNATNDTKNSMIISGSQQTIPRQKKKFLLFGHGGAPAYAPYNSLSGMLLALAQGADGIEMDLSYTKDNVNIVSHGPFPQLQRDKGDPEKNCYAKNRIADTDFKTIRKQCPLPNGEKMMNFDEFLRLTRETIPLYMVELKVYDTSKGMQQMYDALATAKKYGVMDKIIRVSYDPVVRKLLTMQEGIIAGRDAFRIEEYGSELFNDFSYSLMPFSEVLKPEVLSQLRKLGKPIISYTPLTSGDIAKVYELGIHGLLVDDIPLAKETITNLQKKMKK